MTHKKLVASLVALLFALQAVIRFHSSLGHDMAWYLYVAEGLIHGKKLYVDFVEVNPPLGMWLEIPAVWLAQATGVSSTYCFYIFIFLMAAASLALCWRYTRNETVNTRAVFILACAGVLLFLPGDTFGQREHFMVIMVLPWLLLRQQNPAGIAGIERALVGIVAALGIALKPYAIFAPVLVECVLLLQTRDLRRTLAWENLAAVAAIAIYAATVAVIAPQFYDEIIALGRSAYIPYYGLAAKWVLMNAGWAAIFMGLALFGWRSPRVQILLAAAVGFVISYALQGKGFPYHILPATALGALACVAAMQESSASEQHKKIAIAMAGFVAVMLLVSEPQTYQMNRELSARVEALRTPGVRSVFIASNHFAHAFPYVVEQNLQWGSRFPTQWLAPYVAEHWKPGAPVTDPVIAKALNWTIEDFANLKPGIVAIDNTPGQRALLGGFEFLKFWNSDPRFSALWNNYELASDAGGILIYTRKK